MVRSAYVEHCDWLQRVRAQYSDTVHLERMPSSRPVGFAEADASSSPPSPSSRDVAAAAADFTEAPMFWGGAPFEADDGELPMGAIFGSLSLDDSAFDTDIYRSLDDSAFDRPVYRSIFDGQVEFVADTRTAESPVHRSMARAFMEEDVQSKWLQTMPPLLCRQKAGLTPLA